LPLPVVKGAGLFGRNWLHCITLDCWRFIAYRTVHYLTEAWGNVHKVIVYLDNNVIAREMDEECLQILDEVLQ